MPYWLIIQLSGKIIAFGQLISKRIGFTKDSIFIPVNCTAIHSGHLKRTEYLNQTQYIYFLFATKSTESHQFETKPQFPYHYPHMFDGHPALV